jgi:hypothetical protein
MISENKQLYLASQNINSVFNSRRRGVTYITTRNVVA